MSTYEPDDVEGLERSRTAATELSWSLRSVNRAAADVDQALANRIGLRPLDYAAMGHIMSAETHPLGPAELGHRLGITTGSATELVDRLERAHHIERKRTSADRRRVSLLPRKPAVDQILNELGPLFDSLDALASEFSDAEQATINLYLRSATDRLTRYAEQISSHEGSDH